MAHTNIVGVLYQRRVVSQISFSRKLVNQLHLIYRVNFRIAIFTLFRVHIAIAFFMLQWFQQAYKEINI